VSALQILFLFFLQQKNPRKARIPFFGGECLTDSFPVFQRNNLRKACLLLIGAGSSWQRILSPPVHHLQGPLNIPATWPIPGQSQLMIR
jgi:hypothetical protein